MLIGYNYIVWIIFWIILFSDIHLTEVSVSAIMALDMSYIEKKGK